DIFANANTQLPLPKNPTSRNVADFLSKPQGLVYHRRTACGAYHQPLWGCISSRFGVHFLRLDDIQRHAVGDMQNSVLMIYKAFRFGDMQGFRLDFGALLYSFSGLCISRDFLPSAFTIYGRVLCGFS
ncbi:MAG: hypothetical protein IJF05_00950, partial [Clostridia bacterium]|nr:hypothetical protein [Clostridia bacterium]